MILLLDNYDSFVHNLARYFRRLGVEVDVVRNDQTTAAKIAQHRAVQAIVLSPGPCTPTEAGCSLELVQTFAGKLPILGVCLGHQTIAAAFGTQIIRAAEPRHGRSSLITHTQGGIFANVPSPLRVGRYHSLVAEETSLPSELLVTARDEAGVIMALEHRTRPIFGVQFHPESILTEHGYELLANFLKTAGISPRAAASLSQESPASRELAVERTLGPVTF
jgi:anthranilate synthase component 2